MQAYDAHVPHALSYPDHPLQDFLTQSAQRHAKHPALLFYGRPTTYQELDEQASRVARALQSLGVKPGDRVAVMLPNIPQMVIAYFGALRAGAVVVLINPLYVEREVEAQLRDAGATVLFALDHFYPRLRDVRRRTPTQAIILTSVGDALPWLYRLLYTLKAVREGPGRIPWGEGLLSWVDFLERGQPAPRDTPSGELAVLLYTGGTTGLPKGVMLTHRNLVVNVIQCATWFNLQAGQERILAVVPFFHAYGLTICLNTSVAYGCTLILLPRFVTRQVLKTIQRYRPTFFPGIQAMYVAINHDPAVTRYDLSSIRYCISGAGPLAAEVQVEFERLTGGRIVEGYGLTEAAPVTHCNPLKSVRRTGSIGLPYPDTEARVVDLETGQQDVAVGEIGELIVRGPQVMKGYWNRPEETQAMLRDDGWLFTGDLARMDVEGFFSIVDRRKDMIKTRGENVYPREVEEVLYRHPKVQEAAVVGIPDTFSVEMVKAYVVVKDGATVTTSEIVAFCRQELARFKVPREVEFRRELPKTVVGKVLRRCLRDEELARRGQVS